MLAFLAQHWSVLVVRGVAGVLCGVMTFVWLVLMGAPMRSSTARHGGTAAT